MPESQAQVRLAGAVVSGKSKAMPHAVAKEILEKMRGRKMSELPQHVGSKWSHLKAKMARRKRS